MIKTHILAGMVALLSLVGFAGCRPAPEPARTAATGNTPVLRSRLDGVMGTQLKITAIGSDAALLDRAMAAAAGEVCVSAKGWDLVAGSGLFLRAGTGDAPPDDAGEASLRWISDLRHDGQES